MATSFIISRRVIDTVNSLPITDRIPISNALSAEFILGMDPSESMTPLQNMLYAMIRFYVVQDTERGAAAQGEGCQTNGSVKPCRCAFG